MKHHSGRIILLSLGRNSRILSIATDGSDMKVLVDGLQCKPDGVAIDPVNRHLFFSFMGAAQDGDDFWEADGHIERARLDGSEREMIVPTGDVVTGKQITFDPTSGRLYWCDREGLRVMSGRTDGSDVITHVRTGSTDAHRRDPRRHPVGIAVDPRGGFLYWTQKGRPKGDEGRILRAPLTLVPQDPASRTDIEVLLDGLPEPIDLHWDGEASTLYWTDRGAPPRGNTLNRARIRGSAVVDHDILLSGLEEGIGLAHDAVGRRMFVSDLGGRLQVVDLDPPHEARLVFKSKGALTGIAYLQV